MEKIKRIQALLLSAAIVFGIFAGIPFTMGASGDETVLEVEETDEDVSLGDDEIADIPEGDGGFEDGSVDEEEDASETDDAFDVDVIESSSIEGSGLQDVSNDVASNYVPLGWEIVDGLSYYFKPNGKPASNEWLLWENEWYYFKSGGVMAAEEWLRWKGSWYYLKEDGIMAAGEWVDWKNSRYYINAKGVMVTGWSRADTTGEWYHFKSGGAMTTGWLKSGNTWYYLDPSDNGIMATGFRDVGSKTYFFRSSGAMATGWVKVGSDWYFFESSGAMKTGWLKSGNTWYYLNPSDGVMATGLRHDIGGKSYFFRPGGAMATGWVRQGDDWYFFKSGGAMAVSEWARSGSRWYYLKSDGIMADGEWVTPPNGRSYWIMPGGAMATGWNRADTTDKWYYFKSGGEMAAGEWLTWNGDRYYLKPDGTMAAGEPLIIDGKEYIFNDAGKWVQATDERIWMFLKSKGLNDFAVAGIMGNLFAESALRPNNLENAFEIRTGWTDESYTRAVDNGSYKNFAGDAAGYGLAQWTYSTRKQALLNYAKSRGTSIGDLGMQLDFLWIELTGGNYSGTLTVLRSARSVREASDAFMVGYENPANQSETAKATRAGYGQTYYNKFA